MAMSILRQLGLDIQFVLWDVPLWVIEDVLWKYKIRNKRHDWEDYE